MKPAQLDQGRYYRGVPMAGFDLVKELFLATLVIGIIALGFSVALSSPDMPSVTIQAWSNADPVDFATTATAELAGTSGTATYGPPYTDGSDGVQAIGPFMPQQWLGNAMHVDTAQEFVLAPLTTVSGGDATVTDAIAKWKAASADQQQAWASAYTDSLANATAKDGAVSVADGDYGPVPALVGRLTAVAQAGNLDGLLLSGSANGALFQTNYSAPLLFMGDGGYLESIAVQLHLGGDQWGAMNETGNYPGQTWLWFFSIWYNIAPTNTLPNADIVIVGIVGILGALLLFLPFIPILRDLPRWIPVHRLIWRRHHDPGEGSAEA
jgi:hypothetical protein